MSSCCVPVAIASFDDAVYIAWYYLSNTAPTGSRWTATRSNTGDSVTGGYAGAAYVEADKWSAMTWREDRGYYSFEVPEGATHARIEGVAQYLLNAASPADPGVEHGWTINRASFDHALGPTFGSIGSVIASGAVAPDAGHTNDLDADYDAIDAWVEVTPGGYLQVCIAVEPSMTQVWGGKGLPSDTGLVNRAYADLESGWFYMTTIYLGGPGLTGYPKVTFYSVPGAPADSVPSGTPVRDTRVGTGNGSADAFSTLTPYVPGSLRVRVDGVLQVATETDPAAGAFTLTFVPDAGEAISAAWSVA